MNEHLRDRINRKLGLNTPDDQKVLTKEDIIEMLRMMIRINYGYAHAQLFHPGLAVWPGDDLGEAVDMVDAAELEKEQGYFDEAARWREVMRERIGGAS